MTRLTYPLSLALWLAIVVVGLAWRPALPVDETRYLAVAWEMWQRGDFIVPHLNGVAYHHKPPLLFWLMQAGWKVAGVSEYWARLVAPLFALFALAATRTLGRILFPERPAVGETAPLIAIGAAIYALFASLTFFDMLVTFFALLGWIGIGLAWRGRAALGWTIAALALGLGVLSKGPVQLVHFLPAALLAPLWIGRARAEGWSWKRWYGGVGLAIAGGALIALAWALPAAWRGGEDFARMLFVGQHAGRMVESFQHERPWWWYLPLLLAMLFPWTMWPGAWRRLVLLAPWGEAGTRFLIVTFATVIAVFSLISGKQPHYLLPLAPIFAIWLARAIDERPDGDSRLARAPMAALMIALGLALFAFPLLETRLAAWFPRAGLPFGPPTIVFALAIVLAMLGIALWNDHQRPAPTRMAHLAMIAALMLMIAHVGVFAALAPRNDVARAGAMLALAEEAGRPVLHLNDYEGQFHFAGRLRRPLPEGLETEAQAWAERNPNGLIIDYRRDDPSAFDPPPLFWQRYRGRHVVIWGAREVARHGLSLLVDREQR